MSATDSSRLKDKLYKILCKHNCYFNDKVYVPLLDDLIILLNETIDDTISFMDKFYWLSPKTMDERSLTNYK